MKKKSATHMPLLLLIYIIGLSLGLFLLQAVPYYSHKKDLIQFAKWAAEKYSQERILDADPTFGLNYMVYDMEGKCIDYALVSFSGTIPDLDIEKYLASLKENGSGLHYAWVRFNTAESSEYIPLLIATAAIQNQSDGQLSGILLTIRDLPDILGNLISYALLWSFAFFLLFLFLHFSAKKARETEELQRTYIATMNHELKAPITSIKALSETLLDGYVTDPQKQMYYYSTILKEANRLEDTVVEILELSKLQSAKTLYRKETAQAADVFSPILDRYAELCEDTDIQFIAPNLGTESLPQLYTAPALISRVLDLLLHNAVKFTESGSGIIEVHFALEKDRLLVSVRDNGCGITADQLPHIFERFYQGESGQTQQASQSARTHNKSGSGLGLAIVKEILDGLGESIHVESQSGEGSTFTFTVENKSR
ncbi:MAG: HAMP domain-containing histidine kinase [Lachnospiraceae bacterium]|nr:HAMP domain-containing histidine kinase [Lachnospiraceae bacterium]